MGLARPPPARSSGPGSWPQSSCGSWWSYPGRASAGGGREMAKGSAATPSLDPRRRWAATASGRCCSGTPGAGPRASFRRPSACRALAGRLCSSQSRLTGTTQRELWNEGQPDGKERPSPTAHETGPVGAVRADPGGDRRRRVRRLAGQPAVPCPATIPGVAAGIGPLHARGGRLFSTCDLRFVAGGCVSPSRTSGSRIGRGGWNQWPLTSRSTDMSGDAPPPPEPPAPPSRVP
jgi:hypothetical protein